MNKTVKRNKQRLDATFRKLLKENMRQNMLDTFDVNSEGLAESSFEYRREIVASLIKTLGINLYKNTFVYLEKDNLNDFRFLEKLDPEFTTTMKEHIIYKINYESNLGFTVRPNMDMIKNTKDKSRFPVFYRDIEKAPIIIYIDIYRLIERQAALPSSIIWTMVHEVLHNTLDESDEAIIQRKTFEFLYDHGFVDSIALEFTTNVISGLRYQDRLYSEYFVGDFIFNELKKKDPNLLLTYLFTIRDLLYESDDLSDEEQISGLQVISGLINKLEPSEDIEYENLYGDLEYLL